MFKIINLNLFVLINKSNIINLLILILTSRILPLNILSLFHKFVTDKDEMIQKATKAYGEFLDALRCDWRNDPNCN